MPRYKGIPNKIKETNALLFIYREIVRPFLNRYSLHEEQRELKEGIEAFFSVKHRPITWYACETAFTLPGAMWESPSRPFTVIEGVGRRYVKPGSSVVVRQEVNREDYVELEFDNQVFILSDAQFAHVLPNLKVRA